MTKITRTARSTRTYEIYLSLYQAVTGTEEEDKIYKQFSPDFFDLIVIDECHRGSAAKIPPGAKSSPTSTTPPRSA
jgi:type I restriction enzyme R subunit